MSGGNGAADGMRTERIALSAKDLAEETRNRLHVVEQAQISERNHSAGLHADVRAIREELRTVASVAISDLTQRMLGVEFALENQGKLLLEVLEAIENLRGET